MKKRCISALLSFAMLFSVTSSACAAGVQPAAELDDIQLSLELQLNDVAVYSFDEEENALYFTVNEYDLLMEERRATEAALREQGVSQTSIDSSRTNAQEAIFFELAALDRGTLLARGYTDDQITVLQAYDGRALEDAPELRAAAATLSGKITCPEGSTSALTARLDWYWTTQPALYNYNDVTACSWTGTNPSGQSINLALSTNASASYAYVSYYSVADNTTLYKHEYLSFVNTSPYSHTETPFSALASSVNYYAKMGAMRVTIMVPETVTASIAEAAFRFVYAATTTATSYSLSFPISLSISVGANTTEVLNKAVRISSDRTITTY